eukprot:SAG22_NODE_148_length_17459_cov_18.266359_4_plen_656_part_00
MLTCPMHPRLQVAGEQNVRIALHVDNGTFACPSCSSEETKFEFAVLHQGSSNLEPFILDPTSAATNKLVREIYHSTSIGGAPTKDVGLAGTNNSFCIVVDDDCTGGREPYTAEQKRTYCRQKTCRQNHCDAYEKGDLGNGVLGHLKGITNRIQLLVTGKAGDADDAYGTQMSGTIRPSTTYRAVPWYDCDAQKHYACLRYDIRTSVAGTYTAQLKIGSDNLMQYAPYFDVIVNPGKLDPQRSGPVPGSEPGPPLFDRTVAGRDNIFYVEARDMYGNIRDMSSTTGHKRFPGMPGSTDCSVVVRRKDVGTSKTVSCDWLPEQYKYQVTGARDQMTRAGEYTFDVKLGDEAIKGFGGSPFLVTVDPAELSISKMNESLDVINDIVSQCTRNEEQGDNRINAGDETWFTFKSMDKFGNSRTNNDTVQVVFDSPVDNAGNFTHSVWKAGASTHQDGYYNITFGARASYIPEPSFRKFRLSLRLQMRDVKRSECENPMCWSSVDLFSSVLVEVLPSKLDPSSTNMTFRMVTESSTFWASPAINDYGDQWQGCGGNTVIPAGNELSMLVHFKDGLHNPRPDAQADGIFIQAISDGQNEPQLGDMLRTHSNDTHICRIHCNREPCCCGLGPGANSCTDSCPWDNQIDSNWRQRARKVTFVWG